MKKFLISLGIALGLLAFTAGPAFAWHGLGSGNSACNEDGTVTFTFVVDTWDSEHPGTVVTRLGTSSTPATFIETLNQTSDSLDWSISWPDSEESGSGTIYLEFDGTCDTPPTCEELENCTSPPCEQTEQGCPTPPPVITPDAFIFSTCDLGAFIRFEGVGNAYYSIDGVFTNIAITVNPTDIQLGNLVNGTVVTAAFNGGNVKTLTVDLTCPTETPTPSPTPGPTESPTPPWTPTWTPSGAVPPQDANGGDLAFTGFTAGEVIPWAIGLTVLGLLSLAWAARRKSIDEIGYKKN